MGNPWTSRRVLNYAHQGGALEAPSSTLFAFRRALEVGAHALELDLHASSDGVLVVCHDPNVDRTTNSSGQIADLSYAALVELDNAYYFVEGKDAVRDAPPSSYRFRGAAPTERAFGIARLDEVLESFPQTPINIDIKKSAPEVPAYELALAAMLRDFRRSDDVIVTSFNDYTTERFAAAAPEVGTAPGTIGLTAFLQAVRNGDRPDQSLREHVAIQMPLRYAGVWLVDERVLQTAHDLDLALHVWTVDEVSDMEGLIDLGVDAIMTNRPSVLSEVLSTRGVGYATP